MSAGAWFTDAQLENLCAEMASLRATGRMRDGRKLRPLSWREMRAEKINWAKRKNFVEEKAR